MGLLTTTLVIVFLTTTSATPMRLSRHHDADIPEYDRRQEWMHGNRMSMSRSIESHSDSSESDSSEESESSEESQSSEELPITEVTTEVVPTDAMTTASLTSITSGDGSTFTPEPDVITTALPATANVTELCNATLCFTEEIPTAAPITDNRGDN